jgi:hypothetical protein
MTFDEDDFSSEEQLDAVAEFALKHFPWGGGNYKGGRTW